MLPDLPQSDLWTNVAGTIIGGLLLGLILLVLNDFVFRLPALSGLWRFEVTTERTAYKPYDGMKLTYLALLWQEGSIVHGTGEKVAEESSTGQRTYEGKHRTRIEISGHVNRRYLRRSEIVLHFREHGEQRQSSTIQTMTVRSNDKLVGRYASTAANSSGSAVWIRGTNGFRFDDPA